jgi:hypothetical protein
VELLKKKRYENLRKIQNSGWVEHYCWDEAMTTILVTVTVIILKYFFVKNTYPNFIANASTSQVTKISHEKYNNLSKKFVTQTCENDTFLCDIHTHKCQFLNIYFC